MAGKDRYDWSEIDPYIKRHYKTKTATEIAKHFNMKRTPSQIRDRARLLGVLKQDKFKWTKARRLTVRTLYPRVGARPIADKYGICIMRVNKFAQSIGVKYKPKDEYISTQGYKMQGKSKSRKAEHRRIMEEYLGRELTSNEVVHHINGDKLDNRIENLQVMTRAEHIEVHRKELNRAKGI